jgi:PA domain
MLPRLRSDVRRKVVGLALLFALTGVVYAAPTAAFAATEPGVQLRLSESPMQIYPAGPADFGPALIRGGDLGNNVVVGLDDANDAGPSTTDACTPLTNLHPGPQPFWVVLVDRGTCSFTTKVKNAQNAGASDVLVANDVPGPPAGMAGTDPTIVIPSVMIGQELGAQLKALSPSGFIGFARLGLFDTTALGVFDTTPPVFNVPSELSFNATGPSGALVSREVVGAYITDNVDPAPIFTCQPNFLRVFSIGSTQVQCQAADVNLNGTDRTFVVHVKGAPEQLRDLSITVAGLGLPNGTAKKLGAQLTEADAAIAAGETPGACLALQGFINEVRKAGRRIAPADAGRLKADAKRIRAVLAC